MRILLANTTCKIGGVSTFMLALRAELVAAGHQCELFFLERGSMESHLPSGVPVHFGSLADLLRLVERERFDVVHANNSDWASGISAVKRAGATLVVTAHKVREPAWTYGWTRRECDAFAAVSGWVARALQPYTDLRVYTVRNGVDVHRFAPADAVEGGAGPIVAWVGRAAAPVKRIQLLAAVAPALRAAGVRIWIIDQQGPDKAFEVFPEAAATLRDCAESWQGVPYADMPAVYRRVAASGGALLSTSQSEGLPLALIEAQACGCPVIAADVRGVNETVSPAHGGVLYQADVAPEALARLIVDLLSDGAAMRARGNAAAAHVRATFSLGRMADEYLRLYREAPYPPVAHGRRARRRLSPIWRRRAYFGQRWGVADRQFEVARELGRAGHWRLAAAAARAALVVAPTLFVRPRRLVFLLASLWRATRQGRASTTPRELAAR